MTELTLEKKLEIVNAINTAVAKGYTVKTGKSVMPFGASMHGDKMVYMNRILSDPQHFAMIAIREKYRIIIEAESEVIYEPPLTTESK